jgi:hypothetical protein
LVYFQVALHTNYCFLRHPRDLFFPCKHDGKKGFVLGTVQVGTGLLVAEVNVNTMCELGSGGVSLVCFSDFLFLSFPESWLQRFFNTHYNYFWPCLFSHHMRTMYCFMTTLVLHVCCGLIRTDIIVNLQTVLGGFSLHSPGYM